MSGPTLLAWRVAQTLVWVAGAGLLVTLMVVPDIGIHAFWNVLIPIAPALFVFAPGLWRNICPLGSTALFPRHVGLSRRGRLSKEQVGLLRLVAVVVLLLIVPLRHVVLDTNGPATAVTIGALAAVSVLMGLSFEWKSGWCSGLCPVHPVETLYGSAPLLSVPNAHCGPCEQCVSPCPDSMPALDPETGCGTPVERVAGTLLLGGFVGFIWGWFHVRDYAGSEGWSHLATAYGMPAAGCLATLLLYVVSGRLLPARHRPVLVRCFAAAAIACYYWYRLPALFGFGPFPGDGMLVDLRDVLPAWFPVASRVTTTVLFTWWLVARRGEPRAWQVRPAFAD